MDTRLAFYLEAVPLWQIASIAILVVGVTLLIPRKYRMGTAIAVMTFWLSLHKYSRLETLSQLSKTTYFLTYILIILAAALHPGRRQRVSAMAWIYVALALLRPIYLMTVIDRDIALIHSFGWLMLVLAAISVTRTMVDQRAIMYVVASLVWGFGFAVGIGLTSIVFDTEVAFSSGLGRFAPYGALGGLMGPLYFQSSVLAAYVALRDPRRYVKFLLGGLSVVSIGLAIMTGTRAPVYLIVIAFVPILIPMTRRPIFAIFFWSTGVVCLTWLISLAPKLDLERLANLETTRTRILIQYLDVISDRPLFGLLASQGQTSIAAAEIGAHPHNSYLKALYVGGVSYALPLFAIMGYAAYCTTAVWLNRKKMREDPLLISVFAVFLFCIYLHGFATLVNLTAAESLAFIHILLATQFMTWWGNRRTTFPRERPVSAGVYQYA